MRRNVLKIDLKPTQILVLGFLVIIFIGTCLLALPIASQQGKSIGFIDALFTATSAVSITGLVVVNTFSHWTLFGKIVIIILTQIGGLGFMTITTTLFMLLGKKIGLKDRLLIQHSLNYHNLSGISKLVKKVVIGTLIIELIGSVLLSFQFVPEYGLYGVFLAVFYSISSVCNAGFDILGDSSLVPYFNKDLFNLTVILLIIVGGLGYTVWLDYITTIKEAFKFRYGIKRAFDKLSLHSKLVTCINLSLIFFGLILFLILEYNNPITLEPLSLKDKVSGSLFHSVSLRSAGYYNMPLQGFTDASIFLSMIFMFIGGSPGGFAGGIKTVTFGVLFLAVISVVKGKEDVEVFQRRISWDVIKRAFTLVAISITFIIGITMILFFTEDASFFEIIFETLSSFSTVGLTLGITSDLTVIGKLLISMLMFVGRIGPATLVTALSMRDKADMNTIRFPEDKIMIG